MNRCDMCRWSEWIRDASEWGTCHRFDTYADVDEQKHDGAKAIPRALTKGHVAETLTVHRLFGCVQHEPKETR